MTAPRKPPPAKPKALDPPRPKPTAPPDPPDDGDRYRLLLARLGGIHAATVVGGWTACRECLTDWPCATARAATEVAEL